MRTCEKITRNIAGIAHAARSGPAERRALRRRYLFDGLRYLVPYVGVETPDGLFMLPTADRTVARSMFVSGSWEPQVLDSAISILGDMPAAWFVEIGANIGTTTIAVGRHGFKVLAIEPSPVNVRLLRANVLLNDLEECVTIVESAISDSEGTALLNLSPVNSGAHSISSNQGGDAVEVATVRLDSVLAAQAVLPSDIGLLWVDAEGHELEVLTGAPGVCAASPPTVLEVLPAGASPERKQLIDLIERHWSQFIDLRQPELPHVDMRKLMAEGRGTDVLMLR